MWLSRQFVLFLIYSFMGWIYETIYCTVKRRKWENRGFLYGPVCPIYGTGAVTVSLLMGVLPVPEDGNISLWSVFLLSLFGSAVLEYGTSWALEKLFHAVWWDYSGLPLNIHGRISLFTSIGFGCAGVLIVYVLAPFTEGLADRVPDGWMEFLALLGMALFAADLTLTVSALTDFAARVKRFEDSLNVRMDTLVETAYRRTAGAKSRVADESERLRARLGSLNRASHLALKRVRAFRYPKTENEKLRAMLQELRERAKRGNKS